MPSLRNLLLKFILRRSAKAGQRITLAELRQVFERDGVKHGKVHPDVSATRVDAGGCPADWLTTGKKSDERVMLYLHGGAYVFASARSHRGFVSQLVAASGIRALVVDVRLAPEHPFPAAHDDALGAYRWLLKQGIAPHDIAVVGDSSGAGLALGMLYVAREQRLPMPACAALISPWLDLTLRGESVQTNAKKDALLRANKLTEWAAMYAGGRSLTDPRISPAFGNADGLPPLWISVATDELLYSETLEFAQKARANGVKVDLAVGAGLTHVWPFFYGLLPEAKTTIREIVGFVQRELDARTSVEEVRQAIAV